MEICKRSHNSQTVAAQAAAAAAAAAAVQAAPGGLTAADVDYIELSADGDAELDTRELKELAQAFGRSGAPNNKKNKQNNQSSTSSTNVKRNKSVAVGTVKANVGHVGYASGAAALIKAALCLHNRYLPSLPHWGGPKDDHQRTWDESSFYVCQDSRAWVKNAGDRRHCAVSGVAVDAEAIAKQERANKERRRRDRAAAGVEGEGVESEDEEKGAAVAKQLPMWIENLFLFALVWSVAGLIDGPSRPKFDAFFRQICTAKAPRGYEKVDGQFGESVGFAKFFPEDATVYEYTWDMSKHSWKLWVDTITKEETRIPKEASFETIIVPTLDTARYSYLLSTLLVDGRATLFVGPTGTGKTSYVQKLLLGLDAGLWQTIFINYSAQTHANQAQDIIDGKLDKRKKGTFGPPPGKKMLGRSGGMYASPPSETALACAQSSAVVSYPAQ